MEDLRSGRGCCLSYAEEGADELRHEHMDKETPQFRLESKSEVEVQRSPAEGRTVRRKRWEVLCQHRLKRRHTEKQ